jgi:hypothetical protein
MRLFIGQDYFGNVHITDERDCLPPDLTDFHEVSLPFNERFYNTDDPTMIVEISGRHDYINEIFSIERKGV